MLETTEIEKKSLEAHVELCAERYNALETKLCVLEDKLSGLKAMIIEVHSIVEKMADKRNDQLIAWGLGTIGFLVASCFFVGGRGTANPLWSGLRHLVFPHKCLMWAPAGIELPRRSYKKRTK